MSPDLLGQILCNLKLNKSPNILTDFENFEDAGIYKLTDEIALVQSVDFFTPIVDDPYYFGQIAVVNSLSDIYAMGASPIIAMNIAEFPVKSIPKDYFIKILKGALDKLNEAETYLIGGHTVEGEELKYGLSVTGIVHPEKFYSNSNAKVGDKIIITKKLGTGIIGTAIKGEFADAKIVEQAIYYMTQLNKYALEILKKYNSVHAVTDITGFGLIGHLLEILVASRKNGKIFLDKIPFIEGIHEYADMGLIPEGAYNNMKFYECRVNFSEKIDELSKILLFDPQTSGGFIICVDSKDSESLLNELNKNKIEAYEIGEITDEGEGKLFIE